MANSEGGPIALLQRATYTCSVLRANGEPSSAMHSNAQRSKQQIIRIRLLLKCTEVRKPTLLYGLVTIVLRFDDCQKLSDGFTEKGLSMSQMLLFQQPTPQLSCDRGIYISLRLRVETPD